MTQNNSTTYAANLAQRWIHIALMGDPSLRLHPVAPPASLTVTTNGGGGVDLCWHASPDSVVGYHVYRATTTAGPFSRLTGSLITATNYTDPLVSSNVYMVRGVKLEVSASGTYYNPSQGIFQSLDCSFSQPSIVWLQPTNNAIFLAPATLQLSASTFDPANSITNVAFYTNGLKLREFTVPPYSLNWSNVPLGIYLLSARASASGGFTTNSDTVVLRVDNGGAPGLTITPLGPRSNAITGQDILGRIYHVQFATDLQTTNWQSLGTATTDVSGTFQLIDSNSAPQRLYRTGYP